MVDHVVAGDLAEVVVAGGPGQQRGADEAGVGLRGAGMTGGAARGAVVQVPRPGLDVAGNRGGERLEHRPQPAGEAGWAIVIDDVHRLQDLQGQVDADAERGSDLADGAGQDLLAGPMAAQQGDQGALHGTADHRVPAAVLRSDVGAVECPDQPRVVRCRAAAQVHTCVAPVERSGTVEQRQLLGLTVRAGRDRRGRLERAALRAVAARGLARSGGALGHAGQEQLVVTDAGQVRGDDDRGPGVDGGGGAVLAGLAPAQPAEAGLERDGAVAGAALPGSVPEVGGGEVVAGQAHALAVGQAPGPAFRAAGDRAGDLPAAPSRATMSVPVRPGAASGRRGGAARSWRPAARPPIPQRRPLRRAARLRSRAG